ncbi:MAG: helix-turn-helix domain-containing protein [Candidatus Aenigmatarchaeota archaeon]
MNFVEELRSIINGSLLGDACIRVDKEKYFTFKYTAKDKKFLENLKKFFESYKIRCWITVDNPGVHSLSFYINTCHYKQFMELRGKWYIKENGKTSKMLPDDLEITPTTLLYWYLGDGCLVRRKNDENRVPTLCLATNCFSKKDVEILLEKLRKRKLNFYATESASGFNKGEKAGYALYSKVQDGTPLRFFQTIGINCPKEILDCSTGRKGIDHRERFFRDKWPTEDDWVKILSNTNIGSILRRRRLGMGLTQKQLGERVGIRRENIRDVELGKRHFCVNNFKKVLVAAHLTPSYLLGKFVPAAKKLIKVAEITKSMRI